MIVTNYSDVQTPQFRVLSDGQCQELYLASLECLKRVGIKINHPQAKELLASAGARVESDRVYIPPYIIQDALTIAPRTFTIWGRQGGKEMRIAPDRVKRFWRAVSAATTICRRALPPSPVRSRSHTSSSTTSASASRTESTCAGRWMSCAASRIRIVRLWPCTRCC